MEQGFGIQGRSTAELVTARIEEELGINERREEMKLNWPPVHCEGTHPTGRFSV